MERITSAFVFKSCSSAFASSGSAWKLQYANTASLFFFISYASASRFARGSVEISALCCRTSVVTAVKSSSFLTRTANSYSFLSFSSIGAILACCRENANRQHKNRSLERFLCSSYLFLYLFAFFCGGSGGSGCSTSSCRRRNRFFLVFVLGERFHWIGMAVAGWDQAANDNVLFQATKLINL